VIAPTALMCVPGARSAARKKALLERVTVVTMDAPLTASLTEPALIHSRLNCAFALSMKACLLSLAG
jgi:hypothetical protein